MGALLANPLVQKFLFWIAQWAFSKLFDAGKDLISDERIKAHVSKNLAEYEKRILEYDELSDSGKLTEADKERIRNEKIKLEESLFNDIKR